LQVDPRCADAYVSRGWSLFITGREGAEEDARVYLDLSQGRDEYAPYMALLGSFASRRAGKEADAHAFLEGRLGKDWPAPLFRYLRREISADELLAAAGNDGALTEARVFLGIDLLLSDQTTSAAQLLRWVRDHGANRFVAIDLARETLKRLE
jgi:hypothetical protein